MRNVFVIATVAVVLTLTASCGEPTAFSKMCSAIHEANVAVIEDEGFGGPREREKLQEALSYADAAAEEVGEEKAEDIRLLADEIEAYLSEGRLIDSMAVTDSYSKVCNVNEL